MSAINQISLQSGTLGAIGSGVPLQINGQSTLNLTQQHNGLHGLFAAVAEQENGFVKKYEVFEITEDLLLLSTVWQRLRQERDAKPQIMVMPTSITDRILFKNITSDDRYKTEQIRDYYHKKLMLWALNEIRLTSFRQDLKKFIQSDGKVFQENMKPLAYRLPEFYDYDLKFDELFLEHNTKVNQDRINIVTEKRLTLVETIMRKRKHMTVKEYWFTDDNDNLNLLVVNKDNPLLKLMDFYALTPFKVNAVFSKKVRDNKEYCILDKYSFS